MDPLFYFPLDFEFTPFLIQMDAVFCIVIYILNYIYYTPVDLVFESLFKYSWLTVLKVFPKSMNIIFSAGLFSTLFLLPHFIIIRDCL